MNKISYETDIGAKDELCLKLVGSTKPNYRSSDDINLNIKFEDMDNIYSLVTKMNRHELLWANKVREKEDLKNLDPKKAIDDFLLGVDIQRNIEENPNMPETQRRMLLESLKEPYKTLEYYEGSFNMINSAYMSGDFEEFKEGLKDLILKISLL
jgi:hypothetical protein